MKIDMQYFGVQMRIMRETKKLSQTDVAAVLNCKPQFVSNWERGMSAPPIEMCRTLCLIYGVKPEEMESMLNEAFRLKTHSEMFPKRKKTKGA